MNANTLDLWPHETAECPLCHGAISKRTPLITATEAMQRIGSVDRGPLLARINTDARPTCPHCKQFLDVVFHSESRTHCKTCKRERALVDGLCDDCTIAEFGTLMPVDSSDSRLGVQAIPLVYSVAIVGEPQKPLGTFMGAVRNALADGAPVDPITALRELRAAISDFRGHGMPGFTDRAEAILALDQADKALAAVGETFGAADIIKGIAILNSAAEEGNFSALLRRLHSDQEAMNSMWRDIWFFSGWKRLYRKMEKHIDAAVARGDQAAIKKYHGNDFLRVARNKENAYLRLAGAGYMP